MSGFPAIGGLTVGSNATTVYEFPRIGSMSPPPAPAPIPLLLDTFTAADGTDPTTRDMDVFPAGAGANRWRWEGEDLTSVWEPGYPPYVSAGVDYYPLQQGRIQSGALTPTQSQTFTVGMFAPSTTVDLGLNLKLRTDSSSELLSAPSVFLYLHGFEGLDSIGQAVGLNLILFQLNDAGGDSGIEVVMKIDGRIEGYAYDIDWSDSVFADVPGSKKIGVYVTSGQITLVANGAAVQTVSPGIAFQGPWTEANLQAQNPVISDYLSDYQGNRIEAVGVYANLTLEQAIALTA